MPRKAKPEMTLLEMTVARPSVAVTEDSSSSSRLTPHKLKHFSKLRGKAKTVAIEQIEQAAKGIPALEELQRKACDDIDSKINAINGILEILGEDAFKLPMDALGDFHHVMADPEDVLKKLEENAADFDMMSPQSKEKNILPDDLQSKLRTSASLQRNRREIQKGRAVSRKAKPSTEASTPVTSKSLRKIKK